MKTYTFPFKQVTPQSPRRPYVFVKLSNPDTDKLVAVYALIDTGADECALLAGGVVWHLGSGGHPWNTDRPGQTAPYPFRGYSEFSILNSEFVILFCPPSFMRLTHKS